MKIKHIFIITLNFMLCLGWAEFAMCRTENSGLGPLEVRTQYPVSMPFLALYPENTATIGDGTLFLSYSLTVGNTFINTQGFNGGKEEIPHITSVEVDRGLVESDFYDPDIYDPDTTRITNGFRLYIDVESYRHLFRIKYGLSESTEFSVEVPYISFEAGSFDESIENVHSFSGVDNNKASGGYRALTDRYRYDYYIVKDGKFITNTSKPFDAVQGDVVAGFKWNLWKGGDTLPAVSIKLAYKFGTPNQGIDGQDLVSSPDPNWGGYLLLSKGFNDWIVYLGEGLTAIRDNEIYSQHLLHRFMAMEYRITEKSSFVIQTMTQSSIFPRSVSADPRGTFQDGSSFSLSSSTDVFVVGYKSWSGGLFFETGFVEDYNQTGQETDVVLYVELGVGW